VPVSLFRVIPGMPFAGPERGLGATRRSRTTFGVIRGFCLARRASWRPFLCFQQLPPTLNNLQAMECLPAAARQELSAWRSSPERSTNRYSTVIFPQPLHSILNPQVPALFIDASLRPPPTHGPRCYSPRRRDKIGCTHLPRFHSSEFLQNPALSVCDTGADEGAPAKSQKRF
jgi:hypothetical protein